jgi:hypothetical protein
VHSFIRLLIGGGGRRVAGWGIHLEARRMAVI